MGLLSAANRAELEDLFHGLERPVRLVAFTQETGPLGMHGPECDFCSETHQIAEELAGLSNLVEVEVHDFLADTAAREAYAVERIPAIVLADANGADSGARFYGIPSGYEFTTLVRDLMLLSKGRTELAGTTIEALGGLARDVDIKVFVTPTCPYCPGAALLAHQMAMASERVRAQVVEATEFPDLVQRYGVMGVPKIVLNDATDFEGAVPEDVFLRAVVQAGSHELTLPVGGSIR